MKTVKKKNYKMKNSKKITRDAKINQKQSIVLGVCAIKGLIVSKKGRK